MAVWQGSIPEPKQQGGNRHRAHAVWVWLAVSCQESQHCRTSCPSMPATSCAGSRCDCGKSNTTAFRGGRGSFSEPPRPGKLPQHSSAPCSWTCVHTGTGGGGEGGSRADPDTQFELSGGQVLARQLSCPGCWSQQSPAVSVEEDGDSTPCWCAPQKSVCLLHPPGRRLLLRLHPVQPPCPWLATCPAAHAAEA